MAVGDIDEADLWDEALRVVHRQRSEFAAQRGAFVRLHVESGAGAVSRVVHASDGDSASQLR